MRNQKESQYHIRPGEAKDMADLMRLINALAEY
jgi:hypothetical protein